MMMSESMIRRPGARRRVRAAAVLTLSALAALGASSASASAKVTITVTDYWAGGHGLAPLIAKFEKKYPNIVVQEQYVTPTAYSPGLRTALLAGNAADVMATNGGTGQGNSVMAIAPDLVNLASAPKAQAAVPDPAHDLYWRGNKLFGLPLGAGVDGLIYNAALFNQFHLKVPKTFGQLLGLCRAIKADGKVPMALAGNNATFSFLEPAANTVYGTQPTWNQLRRKNKVTFASSKGWRQAMSEFQAMNSAGCFQPGATSAGIPQASSLIATGQAVMWAAPPVAIGAITAVDPNFHAAIFPFPGPTAASTRAIIDYSASVSVNKHSPHVKQATQFAEWLAQPAIDRQWAALNGTVAIADNEHAKLPPNLSAFLPYLKASKTVVLPYLTFTGTVFNDVLPTGLEGVLSGATSGTALLQQMDRGW